MKNAQNLFDILREHFSSHELRRLAAEVGFESDMPGDTASHSRHIHALLTQLRRRRHLIVDFAKILVRERPHVDPTAIDKALNATFHVQAQEIARSEATVRSNSKFEYDVALSFAGEDRNYARALANQLVESGVQVFFDEFEEDAMWGLNLIDHLHDIYCNRSRYVVIFVSKNYLAKTWTNHERQAAQERALREGENGYILPIRIDDTAVPGIPRTLKYLSVELGPEGLARAVLSKFKILTPPKFSVVSEKDNSRGSAKRYSARLLVESHLSRVGLKEVIKAATKWSRGQKSYKLSTRKRWQGIEAHVVCLFLYRSLEDEKNNVWICRSQWVDNSLDSKFRPVRFTGEDIGDGLIIDWSNNANALSEFISQNTMSKADYLESATSLLTKILPLVSRMESLTIGHDKGEISSSEYETEMAKNPGGVRDLYLQASDVDFAPIECKNFSNAFQSVMSFADNIALPFDERGIQTWTCKNRFLLAKQELGYFKDEMKILRLELRNLGLDHEGL